MPPSPGEKLGPYEIIAPIGKGGMGEVWRARDPRVGRDVAIKVSAAQFSERFEREAKAIGALNHPNICTLYDVGPNYLVMEYVEGTPLEGPLQLNQALKYAVQICEALAAAHKKGITHRDLKPANILVTKAGVKLLDFGLAKFVQAAPPAGTPDDATLTMALTGKNEILGTLYYMSPEQLQAQANGQEIDGRSDIFSFGLVLYEILTGKRAFEGSSRASVIAAIMERPAPSIANVAPQALDHLLKTCLAKDPDERWQSARDLKRELELIASASGEVTSVPTAVARRRLLPWIAAAVALGGAAYWRAREPASPRIHSFVLPPEHSAFRSLGEDAGPATLSPDGRRLAFTAMTDGKVQLWVRPLDSPVAQPLAGAEGADFPFWSHDGRWLGFFANGKLKKVEAAGGTVTVLAEASADRGGTWNQDDVILFAPTHTSILVRVSAAGGPLTPVTHLDEKRPDISHRWPSFLPDGKHFLFTSRGKGVFVASLDGKDPPRRLLEESSNSIYSAGYLLYARGDTLLARPFDAARAEFTGEAVTLAQNMASETDSDRGCFTAAAGLLAYHSGLAESRLTWTDRGGNRAGTVGPPAVFEGLEISPDGSRVATVVADGSDARTIWVIDLSRGGRTRAFSGTGALSLVWSPDGKRLAVGFAREGAYVVSAWSADGSGGEEVLSRSNFQIMPTFWMPNGGLLLNVRDSKTGFDIDYLPPTGNDGKRVRAPFLHAPGDQLGGTVCPNGRWIFYASADGFGGIMEGFVARFPGAGSRRQVSTAGADLVRWSRDGKEILFSSRTKLMSATVRETGETLEIAEPRMLFEMRVDCGAIFGAGCFDVSQDGKRFLVMEPTGTALPVALVQNWQAGLKK